MKPTDLLRKSCYVLLQIVDEDTLVSFAKKDPSFHRANMYKYLKLFNKKGWIEMYVLKGFKKRKGIVLTETGRELQRRVYKLAELLREIENDM